MFTIGICDDEIADLSSIKENLITALFDMEDVEYEIYHSGEEVIHSIEAGRLKCSLLLLDIGMDKKDGMEVADFIRKNQVDMDIIFVTNSTEHVFKGYMYKAYAYILKSNLSVDLGNEVRRYIDELYASEETLNISFDGVKRHIPISSIIYVESHNRKLEVHTKSDSYSFYAKMSELESLLTDKGFVRIHQSYMVQKDQITGVSKEEVMISDISLPVSRKYHSIVKNIYGD